MFRYLDCLKVSQLIDDDLQQKAYKSVKKKKQGLRYVCRFSAGPVDLAFRDSSPAGSCKHRTCTRLLS